MPLYDFHCPMCDETHEEFEHPDTKTVYCRNCGQIAYKVWSFPAFFRIKGFNSINGYTLPRYEDLLDEHGYQKG